MENLDVFKRSVLVSALIEFIAKRMGDAFTPEEAAKHLKDRGTFKSLNDRRQAFLITLNQAIATLEIIVDSIQEDVASDEANKNMATLRENIQEQEDRQLAAEDDQLHEVAEIAKNLIARIKAHKH
jgi:hypothetical protein